MGHEFSETAWKEDARKRYWEELEARTGAARQSLGARLFSAEARSKHARWVEIARAETEKCRSSVEALWQAARHSAQGRPLPELATDVLSGSARQIEEAIKVAPEFSLSHAWLGDLYQLLKRGDDARREFECAARLAECWSASVAARLRAKAIPEDERERIRREIRRESDGQFLGQLTGGGGYQRGDFFSMANAISRAKPDEGAIIASVAAKLGYSREAVEVVWTTKNP
jgi:hypothetical protein